MKKIALLISCAVVLAASCKKEEPAVIIQAVATIKDSGNGGQSFLQVDDSTAVVPTNITGNPFGKQVRVLTTYCDKGAIDPPAGNKTKFWRSGEVITIDSIRTKRPVQSAVGDAGIEIYRSWVNGIEDGYMTLFFEGLWGTSGNAHEINLEKHFVSDSLCYILKHNPNGDSGAVYRNQGMIAFDIHDMVKPIKPEFDVFVKYTGYNNLPKRIRFHCRNGVYSGPYSDNQQNGDKQLDSAADDNVNIQKFN